MSAEHGFHRIGMISCGPACGGHGKRRGGEVLNLFQLEIQLLGLYGQFCHIFSVTSWMAAYEVGYNLLSQMFSLTDVVEDSLELFELLERWFAHDSKHPVRGVFRSHFQPAAHMSGNQFPCIFVGRAVELFIFPVVQKHVIPYAAAYEALLDSVHLVHSPIDIQQGAVVSIEVGADLRMDA